MQSKQLNPSETNSSTDDELAYMDEINDTQEYVRNLNIATDDKLNLFGEHELEEFIFPDD